MRAQSHLKWHKAILELASIGFAAYAFGWQTAVLVFLIMWWANVARDIK